MPGEVVDSDLFCARCAYNLRTLAVSGRCPECGLAVSSSLPPTDFRFGKMVTAFRARRGLALFVVGILLSTALNVAFAAVLRLMYVLPEGLLRIASPAWHYTNLLAYVLMAVGLILATWPYGPRGDRFLWPVGVAVAVFGAACAIPSIVDFSLARLTTGGSTYSTAVFWWIAPSARQSAFLLMHVLVWVHLLTRVRYTRNRALWSAMAAVVLIQFVRFAFSAWLLLALIDRIKYMTISAGLVQFRVTEPVLKAVSLASLLGMPHHRIVGVASIITVAALWLYLRKLNRVRYHVLTRPTTTTCLDGDVR